MDNLLKSFFKTVKHEIKNFASHLVHQKSRWDKQVLMIFYQKLRRAWSQHRFKWWMNKFATVSQTKAKSQTLDTWDKSFISAKSNQLDSATSSSKSSASSNFDKRDLCGRRNICQEVFPRSWHLRWIKRRLDNQARFTIICDRGYFLRHTIAIKSSPQWIKTGSLNYIDRWRKLHLLRCRTKHAIQ